MSNAQVKKNSSNTWDQYKADTLSELKPILGGGIAWNYISEPEELQDTVEEIVQTVTIEMCKTAHEIAENSIRDKEDLLAFRLGEEKDVFIALEKKIYDDTYDRIDPSKYHLSGKISAPDLEQFESAFFQLCIEVSLIQIYIEFHLRSSDEYGKRIEVFDPYKNFKPWHVTVSATDEYFCSDAVNSELKTFSSSLKYITQDTYGNLFDHT